MTRFMPLLFFSTLAWSSHLDNCLSLKPFIKEAFERYTTISYWYGVAQAKKESGCRWRKSLDGQGSIGYFQLAPKFLDAYLRPLFPDYDKPYSKDHFYASAYYLRMLDGNYPVWVVFARYNGGNWVLKECKGIYDWSYCRANCKRGYVCVLKENGVCMQYRFACDINYDYPVFIYKHGQKYREGNDKRGFWR